MQELVSDEKSAWVEKQEESVNHQSVKLPALVFPTVFLELYSAIKERKDYMETYPFVIALRTRVLIMGGRGVTARFTASGKVPLGCWRAFGSAT